jgi:UDP-N-acetylmuramoyl-tripeptide--D-alanyl-D-alanine ligase
LLRTVLRVGHRVHATAANLNNRIGVPLTLLEAQEDAEFVVVELGTSERGEIEALTRITEPDVAVITTVAESHLEGLGDLEGVMEEKLALLLHLRPGAAALVGDVPPELPERARRLHEGVRVAGFSDLADPPFRGRAESVDQSGIVPFRFQGVLVRPGLPGAHGAFNTLLALATARLLGVGVADSGDGPLVEAVGAVRPGALRGEQRRVGRMTLALDCYNANPQSVRAALELLASLPSRGARVAVLGSMLELGERSLALHREILGEARSLPIDIILAVGRFAEALEVEKAETADATDWAHGVAGEAPEGPEVLIAHEVEEAWERLRPRLGGDETVLLKASRGVALERLIPRFESDFAGKGG